MLHSTCGVELIDQLSVWRNEDRCQLAVVGDRHRLPVANALQYLPAVVS